jgi:hypothetical protein
MADSTTRSTPRLAAKLALTVGAVGLGVAGLTGAFGGWTSTITQDQDVIAGTVDLAMPSQTLTTSFGTVESPLAPGDSGARFFTLTNTSSQALDLTNVRFYAPITVNSDVDLLAPFTSQATPTQVGQDVTVHIQGCASAWSGSGVAATCASPWDVFGTSGTYGSLNDVADDENSEDIKTTSAGAAGAMATGTTAYYKVSYAVRDAEDINGATAGANATVTWTFKADPRAATNDK